MILETDSPVALLADVQRMEQVLLSMPQADIRTVHTFYRGVYERKIIIPPWTVLTGAEHRTDYRVRVERGTIAVNTENGVIVFTGPCEFDAKAGIKRVGRVFDEEVVWVDIYSNPDDCTDFSELESRLYVVPECGLGENRVAAKIESDRADYQRFLSQLGTTEDALRSIVEIDDLIPMPGAFDVELRDSRIHGKGMFALRHFSAGEVICPGRLGGRRTPAGRYINHSSSPNVEPVKEGDDIYAVALRGIAPNEELLVNYRASMLVNFGLKLSENPLCQDG